MGAKTPVTELATSSHFNEFRAKFSSIRNNHECVDGREFCFKVEATN